MTKKRGIIYLIIGVIFGIFDFYYQTYVQELGLSTLPLTVLCFGIWLVPLLKIAWYESKQSQSRRKTVVASMLTWSSSIVSYYLFLAINLMFIGRESSIYLHISNHSSPYFWSNWISVFYNQVLIGIIEWLPLALVGGFVIGRFVYFLVTHLSKKTTNSDSRS